MTTPAPTNGHRTTRELLVVLDERTRAIQEALGELKTDRSSNRTRIEALEQSCATCRAEVADLPNRVEAIETEQAENRGAARTGQQTGTAGLITGLIAILTQVLPQLFNKP
jgi:hypothetical protein